MSFANKWNIGRQLACLPSRLLSISGRVMGHGLQAVFHWPYLYQVSFTLLGFPVAPTILSALIQRPNFATVSPPVCLLDRKGPTLTDGNKKGESIYHSTVCGGNVRNSSFNQREAAYTSYYLSQTRCSTFGTKNKKIRNHFPFILSFLSQTHISP